MKTINDYTIYCTPEQTKKAMELGMPIEVIIKNHSGNLITYTMVINDDLVRIPTAEQIIGWLEEQEVVIDIMSHYIGCDEHGKRMYVYDWMHNDESSNDIPYNSRKEATLAAINAALEYLTSKK